MKNQSYTMKDIYTIIKPSKLLPKILVYSIIFITFIFILRAAKSMHHSPNNNNNNTPCTQKIPCTNNLISSTKSLPKPLDTNNKTQLQLHHIVFGIGASAKLWDTRKEYIKLWWKPNQTQGHVWLDKPVPISKDDEVLLPPIKISANTTRFRYNNKKGDRSAIRISRIVSESVRLGMEDVRWFVMGDDDTVFVLENLIRVLEKYDYKEFYYIGSSSESHLQNILFSYNMAYGGGGFAISYSLAKALEGMQDGCIEKYSDLYGSDDRIQACMAELGVPLTKEIGFHQFDIYGNVFGLLAAHPIAPIVSLHHLDLIDPIFPNVNQIQALDRLSGPMKLDSAALMQQSICYDKSRKWTVSVSWGYAVQIFRGLVSARKVETPSRTFVNWYKKADQTGFPFNTRSVSKNSCERPIVLIFTNALHNPSTNQTASEYTQYRAQTGPKCKWKMADPFWIHKVKVYKKPDPYLWAKPPRRNCCRILPSKKKNSMAIDVGVCREGETIEL